jgi:hypothetical protein
MIRIPISALALLTGTISAANAQSTGGPPIAFVKSMSTGDEIYLSNDGKTGLVRLYKAPSKVTINHIDLRPEGGEIAFTESFRKLKILGYNDSGQANAGGPRTVREVASPCAVDGPDYHPANGSIIYIERCGPTPSVWSVQRGAPGPDAAPLFSGFQIGRVRWSPSANVIYYAGQRNDGSNILYLYRRSTVDGATDELGMIEGYSTFGVGHSGEKVVWSLNNGGFKLLDVQSATSTSAATVMCLSAHTMAFGPGDITLVYKTPHQAKGDYVMTRSTACGATPSALTGKGEWGSMVDWRETVATPTTQSDALQFREPR